MDWAHTHTYTSLHRTYVCLGHAKALQALLEHEAKSDKSSNTLDFTMDEAVDYDFPDQDESAGGPSQGFNVPAEVYVDKDAAQIQKWFKSMHNEGYQS